jgi:hypothetical protein
MYVNNLRELKVIDRTSESNLESVTASDLPEQKINGIRTGLQCRQNKVSTSSLNAVVVLPRGSQSQ